jgi:hypothetical protein
MGMFTDMLRFLNTAFASSDSCTHCELLIQVWSALTAVPGFEHDTYIPTLFDMYTDFYIALNNNEPTDELVYRADVAREAETIWIQSRLSLGPLLNNILNIKAVGETGKL